MSVYLFPGVTCHYEPSPTTKPVETSEGLLASEDTPAFFLEETWSASWGRKKEGLLGHPCSPLPQWQPTQLSELSLSQSHLSATAIKASFCQLNYCSVGVGALFLSFLWLNFPERGGGRVSACWRSLWVPTLFCPQAPVTSSVRTKHHRASAAIGAVPCVVVS